MIRGRKGKGLISCLNSLSRLNCLNGLRRDSLTAEDVYYKLCSRVFFFLKDEGSHERFEGYNTFILNLSEDKLPVIVLRRKTMPFKISICCCNYLFSEGIKHLVAGDARKMGYRVGIVESEKGITTKTDLLIADFHTFSRMSLEILSQHKVKILLLLTDCLPKVEDQRLLEYISKGIIGILFSRADSTQLKKAIQCAASGELWFTHKKLKDIITCVKNCQRKFDTPPRPGVRRRLFNAFARDTATRISWHVSTSVNHP